MSDFFRLRNDDRNRGHKKLFFLVAVRVHSFTHRATKMWKDLPTATTDFYICLYNFISSNIDNSKKIQKRLQTNKKQTLEHSQFKESSSALAKPETGRIQHCHSSRRASLVKTFPVLTVLYVLPIQKF